MSVACKHEPHACTSALSGHGAVCARGGTRLGSYCRTDPQTQREWVSERCERARAARRVQTPFATPSHPCLPSLFLLAPCQRCARPQRGAPRERTRRTRAPLRLPACWVGASVAASRAPGTALAARRGKPRRASERPRGGARPRPFLTLPTIQIGWEGARGVRAARRCAAQAAVALAFARDRTHRTQPPKRSQTKKGRAGQRALACAHSSPPGA